MAKITYAEWCGWQTNEKCPYAVVFTNREYVMFDNYEEAALEATIAKLQHRLDEFIAWRKNKWEGIT